MLGKKYLWGIPQVQVCARHGNIHGIHRFKMPKKKQKQTAIADSGTWFLLLPKFHISICILRVILVVQEVSIEDHARVTFVECGPNRWDDEIRQVCERVLVFCACTSTAISCMCFIEDLEGCGSGFRSLDGLLQMRNRNKQTYMGAIRSCTLRSMSLFLEESLVHKVVQARKRHHGKVRKLLQCETSLEKKNNAKT